MFELAVAKWFTNFRIILTIILLGLLIYFISFFNGFFADDYHQIIDNPAVHSLTYIPSYFTGSTFYTGSTNLSGNYYKPLLTTSYALLYHVFGENPSGYHIVQVFLHIANAVLIFFLFKSYLKRGVAFLFSLFFLVHPINTEAVVYIANLQDELFLFFGLLTMVVSNNYFFSLKPLLIGLLLFFSLLCKETGVLFLILLPLHSLLFDRKSLSVNSITSLIVFLLCGVLRFLVAGVYFNKLITAPIMNLTLQERLLHLPYIIDFYLKTFFFPKDLIIFQTTIFHSVGFSNFYLPFIIDSIFFILLSLSGVLIYKKVRHSFKTYAFFLIWFLIGLLLHLQFFPLDATVADRWFYFPIIGILGVIAVLADTFIKFNKNSTLKIVGFVAFILLLGIFSFRSMTRSRDWKDQLSLISHDIRYNRESYQLEEGYGLELMKTGKLDEAYPHLLRSTQLFPTTTNLTSLGVYYGNTKQFNKAKGTFQQAMQYGDYLLTYENYSLLLFLTNDHKTNQEFTKNAVKKFPNSYKLWFYLSLSSYVLSDYDVALQAAKQSYSLQPDQIRSYLINVIKNRQTLDMSKL
jgi:hypothetical protein